MKYVYQKKYVDVRYPTHTDDKDNEVGETTTIASSGCGICSIIIALDRIFINNPMSMKKLIDLSMKTGANHSTGTSMRILASALSERIPVILKISDTLEDLLYCLRTGGVAIAHTASSDDYKAVFSKAGHYVVVINEERD